MSKRTIDSRKPVESHVYEDPKLGDGVGVEVATKQKDWDRLKESVDAVATKHQLQVPASRW